MVPSFGVSYGLVGRPKKSLQFSNSQFLVSSLVIPYSSEIDGSENPQDFFLDLNWFHLVLDNLPFLKVIKLQNGIYSYLEERSFKNLSAFFNNRNIGVYYKLKSIGDIVNFLLSSNADMSKENIHGITIGLKDIDLRNARFTKIESITNFGKVDIDKSFFDLLFHHSFPNLTFLKIDFFPVESLPLFKKLIDESSLNKLEYLKIIFVDNPFDLPKNWDNKILHEFFISLTRGNYSNLKTLRLCWNMCEFVFNFDFNIVIEHAKNFRTMIPFIELKFPKGTGLMRNYFLYLKVDFENDMFLKNNENGEKIDFNPVLIEVDCPEFGYNFYILRFKKNLNPAPSISSK